MRAQATQEAKHDDSPGALMAMLQDTMKILAGVTKRVDKFESMFSKGKGKAQTQDSDREERADEEEGF
jgi:hypothetical protein